MGSDLCGVSGKKLLKQRHHILKRMIKGGPGDASRPPSRAEFVVETFEVSLSQVYEVIIDMSLFYSHFSFRTPVRNEIYHGIG